MIFALMKFKVLRGRHIGFQINGEGTGITKAKKKNPQLYAEPTYALLILTKI